MNLSRTPDIRRRKNFWGVILLGLTNFALNFIKSSNTDKYSALFQDEKRSISCPENLPLPHRNLFDRLLISQTIVENMTLVSADVRFTSYQLNLLW